MSNKLSALDSVSSPTSILSTDLIYVVRSGVSYKAPASYMSAFIGSGFQPVNANLTALSTPALGTIDPFGRTLLTLGNAAAVRSYIGAVIGTDVQEYDADLAAIAALATTAYGRSFLTLSVAADARTLAGVVIGTDVQAWASTLDEVAALAGDGYAGRFGGVWQIVAVPPPVVPGGSFTELQYNDSGSFGGVTGWTWDSGTSEMTAGSLVITSSSATSTSPSGGIGYSTGAGGAVTQGTSRTTGVTINKVCGEITLFSAPGSIVATSFTVTNSAMASAADQPHVTVKSSDLGNKYVAFVTAKAIGSFEITFFTTGGVINDAPVFGFDIIKAVTT